MPDTYRGSCVVFLVRLLLDVCNFFQHSIFIFFFLNDTPTPEIYPLSLHDALPISRVPAQSHCIVPRSGYSEGVARRYANPWEARAPSSPSWSSSPPPLCAVARRNRLRRLAARRPDRKSTL